MLMSKPPVHEPAALQRAVLGSGAGPNGGCPRLPGSMAQGHPRQRSVQWAVRPRGSDCRFWWPPTASASPLGVDAGAGHEAAYLEALRNTTPLRISRLAEPVQRDLASAPARGTWRPPVGHLEETDRTATAFTRCRRAHTRVRKCPSGICDTRLEAP